MSYAITTEIEVTWRVDFERRMEIEVLNILQKSFPHSLRDAGSHISLSDILDKNIGLDRRFSLMM